MLNRRQLLQAGGLLGTIPFLSKMAPPALALGSRSLTAGQGHFFVHIPMTSGWDVTLGLDPWTEAKLPDPSDMFIEYRPEDVIALGEEIRLGPAAAILKQHAGSFSVVNGLFVSQVDNGHTTAELYVNTGSAKPGTPAMSVSFAASTQLGDFGVLSSSGVEMGGQFVVSSTLEELADLKNKFDISEILKALYSDNRDNTSYLQSVRKVMDSRVSSRMFIDQLDALSTETPPENPQVIAAAFLTDVAYYAQYVVLMNLDTHAQHEGNHLAEQAKGWAAVSDIFSLFKKLPYGQTGESLFDRTTFLVTSEFARTPALNAAAGKDHNPLTNSVLLAGRGVQGGRSIGGSRSVTRAESPLGDPYHIAYPIDYATGEVQKTRTPQARMIFPENICQTLATIMQVDRERFHAVPTNTLALDRLIKQV